MPLCAYYCIKQRACVWIDESLRKARLSQFLNLQSKPFFQKKALQQKQMIAFLWFKCDYGNYKNSRVLLTTLEKGLAARQT